MGVSDFFDGAASDEPRSRNAVNLLVKATPDHHRDPTEGVSSREIAEALGRGLNLPVASITPEEAQKHFGWMAMFVALDMPASSALTQARLGWRPAGPTLIADLDQARYA